MDPGKLVPWGLWGRYEKNEGAAEHQIAHVGIGSIDRVRIQKVDR